MSPRFLFVAGGTGGHVIPAIAVAQELRALRPDADIHFAGGRRGIEVRLVPEAGFALTRLPAAGLRGLGWRGTLRFALAFGVAAVLALGMLIRRRPAVVLATGGYATAAPAAIASLLRIPLWLQEQNSSPGSTNRVLARWCERVYVAYPEAADVLRAARDVKECPNPVRRELAVSGRQPASDADYASFGLERDRPTLLVFGGSRGAARLNRAVGEAWPAIRRRSSWQLLLQSGQDDIEGTRAAVTRDSDGAPRARVLTFIEDMAAAYRVADLVICRAGASTLAELDAVGTPAFLVPFPHATDDHQRRNARARVVAGASIAIEDAELDAERLQREFFGLIEEESAWRRMQEAATSRDLRQGSSIIARDLLERAGIEVAA